MFLFFFCIVRLQRAHFLIGTAMHDVAVKANFQTHWIPALQKMHYCVLMVRQIMKSLIAIVSVRTYVKFPVKCWNYAEFQNEILTFTVHSCFFALKCAEYMEYVKKVFDKILHVFSSQSESIFFFWLSFVSFYSSKEKSILQIFKTYYIFCQMWIAKFCSNLSNRLLKSIQNFKRLSITNVQVKCFDAFSSRSIPCGETAKIH